jgi:hypothetical protein
LPRCHTREMGVRVKVSAMYSGWIRMIICLHGRIIFGIALRLKAKGVRP